eukprot:128358-Rhodomonas_salina.1
MPATFQTDLSNPPPLSQSQPSIQNKKENSKRGEGDPASEGRAGQGAEHWHWQRTLRALGLRHQLEKVTLGAPCQWFRAFVQLETGPPLCMRAAA